MGEPKGAGIERCVALKDFSDELRSRNLKGSSDERCGLDRHIVLNVLDELDRGEKKAAIGRDELLSNLAVAAVETPRTSSNSSNGSRSEFPTLPPEKVPSGHIGMGAQPVLGRPSVPVGGRSRFGTGNLSIWRRNDVARQLDGDSLRVAPARWALPSPSGERVERSSRPVNGAASLEEINHRSQRGRERTYRRDRANGSTRPQSPDLLERGR